MFFRNNLTLLKNSESSLASKIWCKDAMRTWYTAIETLECALLKNELFGYHNGTQNFQDSIERALLMHKYVVCVDLSQRILIKLGTMMVPKNIIFEKYIPWAFWIRIWKYYSYLRSIFTSFWILIFFHDFQAFWLDFCCPYEKNSQNFGMFTFLFNVISRSDMLRIRSTRHLKAENVIFLFPQFWKLFRQHLLTNFVLSTPQWNSSKKADFFIW